MVKWALILAVILAAQLAHAQSTAISLSVTDADSQQWANGTYQILIYSPPGIPQGPYFVSGTPLSPTKFNGALDGSGAASFSLVPNSAIAPAGTQWTFQVCPQATAACFTQNISVAGASQAVSLTPPGIRVSMVNAPVRVAAYQDPELYANSFGNFYFNLTNNHEEVCTTIGGSSPCTWKELCYLTETCGGGGGGGCSVTGLSDTWVMFVHPGATCDGTADWTWDITSHNMQIGDHTVAASVPAASDSFIIGPDNSLGGASGGTTFAYVLGDHNGLFPSSLGPYSITAASTSAHTLKIASNLSSAIQGGVTLTVSGSTCNNGSYTTVSSTFTLGTVITLTSGPACNTADGSLTVTASSTQTEAYMIGQNNAVAGLQSSNSAATIVGTFNVTGNIGVANSGGANPNTFGSYNSLFNTSYSNVLGYSNQIGTLGAAGSQQNCQVAGSLNNLNFDGLDPTTGGKSSIQYCGIWGDSNGIETRAVTDGDQFDYIWGYTSYIGSDFFTTGYSATGNSFSFLFGWEQTSDDTNNADIAEFGVSNHAGVVRPCSGNCDYAGDTVIQGSQNSVKTVAVGYAAGVNNILHNCDICGIYGYTNDFKDSYALGLGMTTVAQQTATPPVRPQIELVPSTAKIAANTVMQNTDAKKARPTLVVNPAAVLYTQNNTSCNGSNSTISDTLAHAPVSAGMFVLNAYFPNSAANSQPAPVTLIDDGNGNIIVEGLNNSPSITVSAATITYSSGAYSMTFHTAGGGVSATPSSCSATYFGGTPTQTAPTMLVNGGIQLAPHSAAGVPVDVCTAAFDGTIEWVTDATAPTYNGTYTSGGGVHVLVTCDGSSTTWKTH